MFYVDTHCHLDLIKDIHKNPGVEDELPIKSISVTNAPFLFEPNMKLFVNSKNIRIALGMHPELVSQYYQQLDIFETKMSSTRYIGEIGLDGSTNHKMSFPLQKKIFENILSLVSVVDNKILTIHSRSAAGETIELLHKFLGKTNCKVILHWYSGTLSELQLAIKYNFFFSVNHKMVGTKKGQELINYLPIQNILTETDSPFTFDNSISTRLGSLKKTIEGISHLKRRPAEEIKTMIFENFRLLVG